MYSDITEGKVIPNIAKQEIGGYNQKLYLDG